MRYALLALMLVGCAENPTAWQQAMRVTGEEVIVKQDEALSILRDNTTALAAIKAKVDAIPVVSEPERKEVIQSIDEPQETEREPQHTPSIPVSAPAVRLQFYTQDVCRDCTIQQPKAQAAAEELGVSLEVFDLKEHDDAFTQAKITVTPTTVIVIDDAIRVRFVGVVSAAVIVERAKSELSGRQQVQMIVVPDRPIASVKESHARRVELHNKLHGGGNWTWPGGTQESLAKHLQNVHGYGNRPQTVKLVSHGTSCPNGNCPTPRSMRMRWSR